ncbi:MAG: hypothetical protein KGS72_22145 [Cyanobacteria bacterium REEB67]|nr:hypothetical protein [Cyanobacteria bacterium REEB67]
MVNDDRPVLSRFEEKIIDDLAVAFIDPGSDQGDLAHQVISAAIKLGCSPVQVAIEAAKTATGVLTTTRRYEGFFGAACGDLYFDLGEARATLKASRKMGERVRPVIWPQHKAASQQMSDRIAILLA